jgi:DNA-cytosine methyltransferase
LSHWYVNSVDEGHGGVDNSEEFRSIELCAGYGGIHLGLKRVVPNLRTVAFVEIEAFACSNLVAKMEGGLVEPAPIWTNLKTFNAKPFRDRIHIITGGYPCQPFSAAGKRLGTEDPRHLWPHIRKIIKTTRPLLCFFENVEGHLSLGFKEVQQSLRDLGYRVEAGIFSAAEVGAPQQRKRLFILGKLANTGFNAGCSELGEQQEELPKEFQGGHQLADTSEQRLQGLRYSRQEWRCQFTAHDPNGGSVAQWPSRPGQPQHEWEPPRVVGNASMQTGETGERSPREGRIQERIKQPSRENGRNRKTKPPVGGNINGPTDRMDNAKLYQSSDNRTDELRLLGNGVVPDVAEKAFCVLFDKMFNNNQ